MSDNRPDDWSIPSVDDVDAMFASATKIRKYPEVKDISDVTKLDSLGLESIDNSTAHRWNMTRREIERIRAWPRRFIKRDGSVIICRSAKELKREKSKDTWQFIVTRTLIGILAIAFVGVVYSVNT